MEDGNSHSSSLSPPPADVLEAIAQGQVLFDQGPVITKKIIFHGKVAVVKYGRNVRHSEALAVNLVHVHAPTVRVPCVLAVYQTCETDGFQITYIISDWIDGCSLDNVWNTLSTHDKDDICEQLRDIIHTLRQLRPPGPYYVGAVGNMPCTDPIIFDQGPFKDIPSFNAALTDAARPHFRWNLLSIIQRSLARTDSYRIVFTHGDLHISNIMVRQSMSPSESDQHVTGGKRWMVVALVDWECAGWYPEHWEYVKLLSSVKWRSDWAARAQTFLDRHYDEEFLLDNRLRTHLRI
jgi:hypothetical protein